MEAVVVMKAVVMMEAATEPTTMEAPVKAAAKSLRAPDPR